MDISENTHESYYTFNYNQHFPPSVDHNKYYPQFLFLIGLFYILPSLQFVFFQSRDTNIECYYNFKCYNTVGIIPAFNSVISNIFYILYNKSSTSSWKSSIISVIRLIPSVLLFSSFIHFIIYLVYGVFINQFSKFLLNSR